MGIKKIPKFRRSPKSQVRSYRNIIKILTVLRDCKISPRDVSRPDLVKVVMKEIGLRQRAAYELANCIRSISILLKS